MRHILLVLAFTLALIGCGQPSEQAEQATESASPDDSVAAKGDDVFVFESYGTVRTLDPACAYDNVSHQRIQNIYEPLIAFDGSATDAFVPVLAVEVPTVENGGVTEGGTRYTFTIRRGVKFHEGGDLSAEDVAYSLKRHMVVDQDGGPMWMMLEAVVGASSTRDADGNVVPGVFEKIDRAITVDGDAVSIKLPRPFPPLMAVLAYSYGGIVLDKEWAVANGCWDGDMATAARYNNPAFGAEPLQKIANGTGAYRLARWDPSVSFIFERFDDYWNGPPAIKTAIFRYNKEWSSRKLALQNGDADRVAVDQQFMPEVEAMQNVKVYTVPQLSVSAALFCRKVNPEGNPNIGSGKLDGEGVPPDFFADVHVRRAFLHAFDRDVYAADVWNNQVVMPTSPSARGLPFHKEVPIYEFNLNKAAQEMKQAWGGEVWDKGFAMTVVYNAGNAQREAAARMLANNVNSLNPKFRVEVRDMAWKDYTVAYRRHAFPVFLIGWGADYPDPDNFLHTFMASTGVYGRYLGYENEEVDRLTRAARFETDPAKRRSMYERLQGIWYEDAVGCMLYQKIENFVYRDDVDGFTPHPMYDMEWEDLKRLVKNRP